MVKESITVGAILDKNPNYMPELVQTACRYESKIIIVHDNKNINVKSIMGVMALVVKNGATIEITADGPDENAAMIAMKTFFEEYS